jgi:quinol monooxygenase YgiN
MIKHIVAWRLQGGASEKAAAAKKIKTTLEALNGRIPGLLLLEVGIDFNRSEAASDVVLYSEFVNREALDAYIVHPEHVAAAAVVKAVAVERRVADYEA